MAGSDGDGGTTKAQRFEDRVRVIFFVLALPLMAYLVAEIRGNYRMITDLRQKVAEEYVTYARYKQDIDELKAMTLRVLDQLRAHELNQRERWSRDGS